MGGARDKAMYNWDQHESKYQYFLAAYEDELRKVKTCNNFPDTEEAGYF